MVKFTKNKLIIVLFILNVIYLPRKTHKFG